MIVYCGGYSAETLVMERLFQCIQVNQLVAAAPYAR